MTPHAEDTQEWIDRIRSICVPRVYLDIGSGDGFDCGLIKEAFPGTRCIAIEPYESWEVGDQVEKHRDVIGDRNGECLFYVKDLSGVHGMYPRLSRTTISTSVMDVVTLDSFCKREGIEFVDAMKIDVEGAAWDVLIGASEVLKTVKAVHIETEWVGLFNGQTLEDAVFPVLERSGLTQVWSYRVENLGQGDSIWLRQ